jgi:hypothetical protein
MDRRIIEYVGSQSSPVVIDPRHSKVLLREVVSAQVPSTAWRPKIEPLYAQLANRMAADEQRLAQATSRIRKTAALAEFIDPVFVERAAHSCQHGSNAGGSLPLAIAELFAFVEWVAAVQDCYGVQ